MTGSPRSSQQSSPHAQATTAAPAPADTNNTNIGTQAPANSATTGTPSRTSPSNPYVTGYLTPLQDSKRRDANDYYLSGSAGIPSITDFHYAYYTSLGLEPETFPEVRYMFLDLKSMWSTPDIRQDKLSKNFKKLESLDPVDFLEFYAYLSNTLLNYHVGLLPFDAIALNYGYVGLCLPGVGEQCYLQMTREAYRVFEYVFPSDHQAVKVAARKHGGHKPDGYRFLWDVMCNSQPVFCTFKPNQQPLWSKSDGDVLVHAQRWITYFRFEAKKNSYASDAEKSQLFLRSIHDHNLLGTIKSLEMSILTHQAQIGNTGFLPDHLHIQPLADNLALTSQPLESELTYAATGNHFRPTPPTDQLHFMQGSSPSISYTDNRRRSERHRPPGGSRDGSRDSSRRSTDYGKRHRGDKMAAPQTDRLRTATLVCEACFGKGHEANKCWALARALIVGQYIQQNLRQDVLKRVVEAYRARVQPAHAPRSNNFCSSVLNNYCNETGLSPSTICHQFDWDGWADNTTDSLSDSSDESLTEPEEDDHAAAAAQS